VFASLSALFHYTLRYIKRAIIIIIVVIIIIIIIIIIVDF